MPLITETYYLSLTQDNRGILRLRCSQDDTLRTVNLKLYNNGSIFVIPSGVSASISGVKQNGAVFSKPCTISQDRKSVVLQLSSDITNIDGIIVAEIVLNDGEGGRLGTSNFIIQVEKNPIRAGVVQDTETPIEYINDFIEKIQTLTARLNNLITPSGDPSLAEVVDARISSLDGNTYPYLKARIDADIATLNTNKANAANVYTKSQVDNLLENVEIDVDNALSDESENPVQNKVINGAISEIKADLDALDSKVDNVKISDSVKEALLACFEHVALWTEGEGDEYIDALRTALGSIYPNLSTGNVIAGYYLDASGDAIASGGNYYNDKYFEIESGEDYYWVQGFNGYVGGSPPDFSGRTCAYRICYYDESKEFISRQASDPVAFGTAEPRYYKLVIPTGAKYFRVSWSALPCGAIYKAVPDNLYAVTFVLANLDDSEISASINLPSKFTVTRNGKNITNAIKTGNLTAVVNDALDNVAWVKNVFQINQGGSPEIGTQHPETTTRIQNCHTYIMQRGDVISFNNVKAGVRAERISDGEVQHTTAWITDNSDFVVGGES